MDRHFTGKLPAVVDSDEMPDDEDQMAQSDYPFRFEDFFNSGSSSSAVNLAGAPSRPPPPNNVTPPFGFPMAAGSSSGPSNHFRSLSVDSSFFKKGGLTPADEKGKKVEKRPYSHRYSNSMDGSSSKSVESDSTGGTDCGKKIMSPETLAKLALTDPKKAKRIIANRQSAIRSKKRKAEYATDLEKNVEILEKEATALAAEVTTLQEATNIISTENEELKLQFQSIDHQAFLRDALNDALRDEIQQLKRSLGLIPSVNDNLFNGGSPSQNFSHQHNFGNYQQPLHFPQPSNNNQTRNGQPYAGFVGYN